MHAEVNGARLHYQVEGRGDPVLLVHAGIADSRMWEPTVAALAPGFRVVSFDMRGFGQSDLPPGPFSMSADIAGLLDHLAIERTHLVGCSVGGMAVIDFALAHPQRASRLVLVGSAISGNPPGTDDAEHSAIEAADAAGDLDLVNELEIRFWVDGLRPAGAAPAAVRELALIMNREALSRRWDAAEEREPELPAIDRLEEISAPTLVVVGDVDTLRIQAIAQLLAARIPRASLVAIQDAAHLPNLEQPEQFNSALLTFLRADHTESQSR